MATRNQLAEQHILQYESHLKHIDEMLDQANQYIESGDGSKEIIEELTELKNERDELGKYLEDVRQKSPEELENEIMRGAGPMAIWDIVAQRLEKLIEHFN